MKSGDPRLGSALRASSAQYYEAHLGPPSVRTPAMRKYLRQVISVIVKAVAFAALLLRADPLSAQGSGAQYVYDAGGRLVQVIAPNATSAQYTYDPAGNLLAVTPLSASTAAVTGFSEASGATGSTVTIYGSGFSTTPGNNQVSFNGVAATVVSSTTNSLTVTVPSGATTGTITVTDSNGTVTSTQNFVVSPALLAPTITSFSPQIGQPGTTVTVNGSNFPTSTSQETAYVNGAAVPIVSTSANAFTFTVPAGASPGPIMLETPAGAATSASDFFAVPANVSVSSIAFTGQATIGGSPLTATINSPGAYGLIAFAANAGQTVSSDVTNQTFQYCAAGTIYTYGPGWQELGSSNMCPGAGSGTASRSGTYTFVLAPYSSDTGTLTLQLQNAPIVTASATIGGPPVTLTTTIPAQKSQLTFTTTTPNQVVTVHLSGITYPSGDCNAATLTLTGPAPATTVLGTFNLCTTSASGTFATVGTYTLTLVPDGADTGSVTYQLN